MNDNILALLVAAVPFYMVWRYHVAIKAREVVASSLDKYLGEDNPEKYKALLFLMFEDSLSPLMIVKTVFSSFTTTKNDKNKILSFVFDVKSASKEHRKAFSSLLIDICLVNARLAPITYFVVLLGYAAALLVGMIFDASLNLPKKINDIVFKVESAYYKKIT